MKLKNDDNEYDIGFIKDGVFLSVEDHLPTPARAMLIHALFNQVTSDHYDVNDQDQIVVYEYGHVLAMFITAMSRGIMHKTYDPSFQKISPIDDLNQAMSHVFNVADYHISVSPIDMMLSAIREHIHTEYKLKDKT